MSKVDVRALTQAINYQPSNTNTFGLQWMMHLGQAASGRLLLQLLEVIPSVKSMEEPQIVARNYGCPAIHPPAVQKWTETVPCKDTRGGLSLRGRSGTLVKHAALAGL
ncbi:hypothetical protein KI688_005494 [Linnemannia hyalina]|uniref:Uncharacterized protein n=1 Tax=Linnemannia hyalina TaxID=64524 RepID=A0A9P8BM29_9FUNG|nr:hypothetical protein KI688_008916 [Linnemannia hyalina]KAG9060745.1 hypothetical protein KI688_008922 [Linnemannia hyalina]KAG9064041.1 hypothetical protein KI688_004155 [Linnemannia hyalina]KAG9067094.1 hypothetical protein KI688_013007 [Linnemannia hyalina]KAG9067097.1 hypothetical protein KI688_013010 [Linnemannia hyalina]